MKSYGNATEDFLGNVVAKEPKDYILKKIAQNLAYIADELSIANEINNRSLSEAYRCLEDSGVREHKQDGYLELGIDNAPSHCFICGKETDMKKVGGLIMNGDGDTFCACSKCRDRFDSLVQIFVMPNEVFC